MFRLNYEPLKLPTPWGVELPTGERIYAREVRLEVPARTVFLMRPGEPRGHGYLEFEGEIVRHGLDLIEIVEISDAEEG